MCYSATPDRGFLAIAPGLPDFLMAVTRGHRGICRPYQRKSRRHPPQTRPARRPGYVVDGPSSTIERGERPIHHVGERGGWPIYHVGPGGPRPATLRILRRGSRDDEEPRSFSPGKLDAAPEGAECPGLVLRREEWATGTRHSAGHSRSGALNRPQRKAIAAADLSGWPDQGEPSVDGMVYTQEPTREPGEDNCSHRTKREPLGSLLALREHSAGAPRVSITKKCSFPRDFPLVLPFLL